MKKIKNQKNITFYIPAYMKILSYIYIKKPKSITEISAILKITYCHVSKLINLFIFFELCKKEKSGRKSIISLTEKGIKVASNIHESEKQIEIYILKKL